MRLVYVDEAGISNPRQEPYTVVAGIIVDADKKVLATRAALDRIVARYIPEEQQEDFVFHATHLFNGGGKVFVRDDNNPNQKWPLSKRLKIAAEIAAIPQKLRLPIGLAFVERATYPASLGLPDELTARDKERLCHVGAYMACAMQIDLWMRQNTNNELCLMVVEDNDNSRNLLRDSQVYHQNRQIKKLLEPGTEIHFPFRRITQDPLFEPKRRSSLLQLADFCAYVWKRIRVNSEDQLYAPFYEAFRRQVILLDPDNPLGGALPSEKRVQTPAQSRLAQKLARLQ